MDLSPLRMVPVRATQRIRVDYGRRPEWFEPGTEMWILRALTEDLWLAFANVFWRVPTQRLFSVRPAIVFDCCPSSPHSSGAPHPIPGDLGFVSDPRALKPESAGAVQLDEDHPVVFMEWFKGPGDVGMARVADGRLYTVKPRAVEFIRTRPATTGGPIPSGAPGIVSGIEGLVEVRSHGRTWAARDARGTLATAPTLSGIMLMLSSHGGPIELVTGGLRETLTPLPTR